MTPVHLEAMVQKLKHRVSNIEQILPTLASKTGLEALGTQLREELASKADLEALERRVRKEMTEGFDDARRYALVLHEDLKRDTGLIAEHLADVMSRLPPRDR